MRKLNQKAIGWLLFVAIIVVFTALYAVNRNDLTAIWSRLFGKQSSQAVELEKAIEEDLTVDLDDLIITQYDWASWEFLDSSMPAKAEERTKRAGFSDAVSFPFSSFAEGKKYTAEETSAMYRELQEEILRNPVHADMVARGLESIKLSSGKTIGDLNPWLGEFIRATDEAMHIEPGRQHPRGNEIWLTHRSGDGETIFVTEEFRKYTGLTCVLLDRLVKKGVYSWTSEKNFCLNYVAEGSITRTEWSSYQEARPSLVLSYLRKDGKSEFTVGFNLLDKRFEVFSKEKDEIKEPTSPAESSPTPTSPAPTEPSRGPVPTTEPSRGPVPTKPKGGGGGGGGTTPAPTTPGGDDGHQRKDPAAAPVNKGNAQQGGGDNRSSDGPGVFQSQDPATESRIGNANDNGHGHSNPKTVTTVTPQPEGPATGAQQPIAATQESKMNYETDSQSQNTSWKDSQTGQTTNHTQPATSVEYGIVNTEAAKPVTSSAAGDAQQLAEPPID